MNKITKQNGTLLVPDKVVIPFIEGDGVGAEITPVCQRIVDEAVGRAYGGQRVIEWKEVLAGEKAFKQIGSWLPDETMEAFREYMIGIKGPLTTPIGGGIRSLNVALRQTLDLYVCLRPVRWFRGVVTPVKEPEKVDMYIFRENTEDIYAGIEWQQGTPEARKFLKLSLIHISEPTRLLNIMKFTEGGFKLWGYALAEREFPDKTFTWPQYEKIKKEKGEDAAATALLDAEAAGKVVIKDVIADAFLQNTLLVPEEYSVIATLNLNGDYVSDQLAAMVGGIGIAPGANINYDSGYAIFEATHGTAPNIAGKNVVNPCSLLLSSVMMLEYMGWNEAGRLITAALEHAFSEGKATRDLARFMPNGQPLGTKEFGEYIMSVL